ncbi:MAG: nicotinate-nucleotide--dimethylbenzimidazole phosphoribosyltransferase [Acidobacteriota bacterium]|jgi:nicotinate-nucleotide--dimethylbenzimidazole phosphoribosyltransferase|nr:nicotinate-nucleotide--dimethylbenzimidazole phosphoribosyltransferase [Acidobacteriota bacterium]
MDETAVGMQRHLDNLTKPRGSLGRLEAYCVKLARIQGRVPPKVAGKGVYVFAGDHGVAAEGVSLYPQEVTRQMVLNILSGGAAINALAGGSGWDVHLVDAGCVGGSFPPDGELRPVCRFVRARMGEGSRNFLHGPAMTREEVGAALEAGRALAEDAGRRGYGLVAVGDLGIANTSAAAAMLVAAGFDAEEMVDRGTGIDAPMLEHKKDVVKVAVARRAPARTGEAILEQVGGFDLAMMAGFVLGLENRGIGCVLDGFPVTAAAYMAWMMNPAATGWLFAGHLSKVSGHRPVLEKMGLSPVVSLDMRLGEGTGAVIGGHVIELGVRAAGEMASFADAHVTDSGAREERF